MKTNRSSKKQCRQTHKSQAGLWASFRLRAMERLNNHVAQCPRCQRRLALINRVELALTLVKTQTHSTDLLARANNKTLDVLKHSLRFAPKSAVLRTAKADLSRLEKVRPGLERVLNVAACVFVLVMIKTGMSGSLQSYKDQGEAVIHNYYARNLDSQTFDAIFPNNSS